MDNHSDPGHSRAQPEPSQLRGSNLIMVNASNLVDLDPTKCAGNLVKMDVVSGEAKDLASLL